MKTKLILAIFTALTIGFVGCTSPSGGGTLGVVKTYVGENCVVTDNELGSMGDPVSLVYNGQEVKFCCKPCIKKFKANPEKYLSNIK